MIILGIDPGSLVTGYGVIEASSGRLAWVASGEIQNNGRTPMPLRLKKIFETLGGIIDSYHPDEFAIETAFYGKNAQSALKLGHARGAAMLAAVIRELPTHEYSPREVKKAVTGNGSASKEQVQYMVKSLLNLKASPRFYDTTDALAVAICHTHGATRRGRSVKGWKEYFAAQIRKAPVTRRTTKK